MSFSTIVRGFSTSARLSQLIKPPIAVHGIEGLYATALYSAATKQKSLETVQKDLEKIGSILKSDAKFSDFVRNPTISRKLKIAAMKSMTTKLSLNSATANTLEVLAENGRSVKLKALIDSFDTIMSNIKGLVHCEVTTATELDASQRTKLEQALKKFLKPNETIQLKLVINPDIIGGMLVSVGDRFVDLSMISKINKYRMIVEGAD